MSGISKQSLKPKRRSKARLYFGELFYRYKRYLLWRFGGLKFARVNCKENFEYSCFKHSTPLLRKLRDVDMQLQYNKITNLKIAVKQLNNVVIYPGETFSYWRLIGKPTAKKGYLNGLVLFCGRFGEGIGGGLCQLSNLIYWMTIHTPLTVTERYRHSFDVFPDSNRTQPFGSGATCVYNYRDLMIKNNTDIAFMLCLKVTDSELIGEWRAQKPVDYKYEVYEKEHKIQSEYWGGYSRHNILYRKVYDKNGNEINDEYVTENHALMMYSPLIAENAEANK